MKRYFRFLVLSVFLTILGSCSTSININDYIDKNQPIELTIRTTDSVIHYESFVIPINSDKYNKIIQWGNENTKGWKTDFVSYCVMNGFVIIQDDFRLLRMYNGVVIGFTDKNGNRKQYHKSVKEDDLKFLLYQNQ